MLPNSTIVVECVCIDSTDPAFACAVKKFYFAISSCSKSLIVHFQHFLQLIYLFTFHALFRAYLFLLGPNASSMNVLISRAFSTWYSVLCAWMIECFTSKLIFFSIAMAQIDNSLDRGISSLMPNVWRSIGSCICCKIALTIFLRI